MLLVSLMLHNTVLLADIAGFEEVSCCESHCPQAGGEGYWKAYLLLVQIRLSLPRVLTPYRNHEVIKGCYLKHKFVAICYILTFLIGIDITVNGESFQIFIKIEGT